ncbi:uncharacterized protein LOC109707702 [Ananas comosus]|uniref:Uncharacterized protein LOC109707702 n=2 Tax=Ananas comosus TaxID=4615 RepID=A0A6P5ETX3_ANACO|nr:uncharacterized protein LOC109707702 [Ananas comosus]
MDPPMQRTSSSSGARILKLHLRRAEAAEEEEAAAAEAVWVRAEELVDLGLVGRALGLDPATVRLNGYFLSRGSETHASSSLTWGSLLSFFAARALPCGASPAAPLAVHGKTLNPRAPASPDAGNHSVCFKRMGALQDDESPLKKNRIAESSSVDDDCDDGILCMKRRLCLDDSHRPPKKPKTAEFCSSGSAAVGKALFSYSCIDEHGKKKKRPREEEMLVSSISHKRVR